MSRIGKMPIELPKGVSVALEGNEIRVKGPKGELRRSVPPLVDVKVTAEQVTVDRASGDRKGRAMHGLARSLIQNMVTGVSAGFTRELEINGVGYRAEAKPGAINMSLGYSHPLELILPEGVSAKVEKNRVILSGIDKESLGQTAAVIRSQRGPEPYKGKGIKYVEEQIRRKVGKAGVG